MRGGFAFSISVHALILLLIILGMPFLRVKPPEIPPPITVELVQAGKQPTTNKVSPVNKVEKQVRDETPPPPTPPPPPAEQPPTPEPPKLQEEPREPLPAAPKLASVDSQAPALETPEVNLKQQMAPAPKIAQVDDGVPTLSAPKTSLKKALAPAPQLTAMADIKVPTLNAPAKVDLKRPQPKVPTKSFDSVLKTLTKAEQQEPSPEPPQKPTRVASRATGAQAPLSANLTASELGALSQQLARCWSLPASAKDAQNLVVDLDVTINPDRTVATAQVVDQGRMASDPAFAAAARAAMRAVRMPQCTPLELPPDKYQEWQSMNIHFDPKEMLGQ